MQSAVVNNLLVIDKNLAKQEHNDHVLKTEHLRLWGHVDENQRERERGGGGRQFFF